MKENYSLEIGKRIKLLRESEGMSQKAFGDKLAVTDTTISGWESGRRIPKDSSVLSICREFNINEDWLSQGIEPMRMEMDKEEEIIAFIGKTFSQDKNNFTKDMIYALSKLNEEQWDLLEEIADLILNKKS